MKTLFHIIIVMLSLLFSFTWNFMWVYAATNSTSNEGFFIIPKWSDYVGTWIIENWETRAKTTLDAVKRVAEPWSWDANTTLWERYNDEAENMRNDVWQQFATWIMNWDTLINYTVYLVRFLSQISLVIWAAMFIYAGYTYAMWVFNWHASKWTEYIKSAIIWIVVVIFSYAIIRILTLAFLT